MNERQPLRISTMEAWERAADNTVTFLDVVDPGTYEELDVMIADAVRIDPRKIKDECGNLPKRDTILAY